MRRFTDTNPDELAIEHCLWAASQGLRPKDVIASVGSDSPTIPAATWHDAQVVLTDAWNAFRQSSGYPESAENP